MYNYPSTCPECDDAYYTPELHLGQEVIHCSKCGSVIGEPKGSLAEEPFAALSNGQIVCSESGKEITDIQW